MAIMYANRHIFIYIAVYFANNSFGKDHQFKLYKHTS